MIFQEPMTALNPVMRVGEQIAEVPLVRLGQSRREARDRALELMRLVGIPDPARRAEAYPHELSGGMRQRVMIAIALSGDPRLILCDEPTTALDVTIQDQILKLLQRAAARARTCALVFVSHDLAVIAQTCRRVAVMYAGQIVETGRGRRRVPRAAPPVHARPAALGARLRRRARHALLDPGRAAGPRARRRGLPLPPALPVRAGGLPRAGEFPLLDARQRPRDRVPPPRARAPRRAARAGDREWLRRCSSVRGLHVHYELRGGLGRRLRGRDPEMLRAVDGVDLTIARGETLGLVGESGCGKSTLGRAHRRAVRPDRGRRSAIAGEPLTAKRERAQRRRIQMVFQDPYSSLNPRMTVRQTLAELLRAHQLVPQASVEARCRELLDLVGLGPRALDAHPRQFSGGQRQRVAIARALALEPELLVADEPVSALDVSVQATVLNLLEELREKLGLTVLLIAHNMAVVRHVGDRVAVMYLGRIVEEAPTDELFTNARHPYTQGLLRAVPRLVPGRVSDAAGVVGDPPSPVDLPSGCRFHPRCPIAQEPLCSTEDPGARGAPRATSRPATSRGRSHRRRTFPR